jgi:hypothetical protein
VPDQASSEAEHLRWITVVNAALPSIREDLGASFTDLQ